MARTTHTPPCATDVGTAMTGPKTCGRNSRHFAYCTDSARTKDRLGFPCCGICARKLDRIGFKIFRDTTDDPIAKVTRAAIRTELGPAADVRTVHNGDGATVGFVGRANPADGCVFRCYDRDGGHLGTSGHELGVGEAMTLVLRATKPATNPT
jgi:hypothetical protein